MYINLYLEFGHNIQEIYVTLEPYMQSLQMRCQSWQRKKAKGIVQLDLGQFQSCVTKYTRGKGFVLINLPGGPVKYWLSLMRGRQRVASSLVRPPVSTPASPTKYTTRGALGSTTFFLYELTIFCRRVCLLTLKRNWGASSSTCAVLQLSRQSNTTESSLRSDMNQKEIFIRSNTFIVLPY